MEEIAEESFDTLDVEEYPLFCELDILILLLSALLELYVKPHKGGNYS